MSNERTKFPCGCVFMGEGLPPDKSACEIHSHQLQYSCGCCACLDYRPKFDPSPNKLKSSDPWPVCVCGHIAQDHS